MKKNRKTIFFAIILAIILAIIGRAVISYISKPTPTSITTQYFETLTTGNLDSAKGYLDNIDNTSSYIENARCRGIF